MSEPQEKRYVSLKETLLYGLANGGQVFGYNLFASAGYLSLFFTKVFGIPPVAVGSMMLFLGLWDTINDPIMGSVVDKTRTRYGKMRPYLMFVPVPLGATMLLVFAGPFLLGGASDTAKIVYMYVTYFIWEFFYTIGDIPFWGLSAAISPSPLDRTRAISAARFISGLVGGISVPLLVILMDLSNSGAIGLSLAPVFLILALIGATFGMALFSLSGFCTKERVLQSEKEPGILEGFKVLVKNKPLLLIVISNIVGSLTGIGSVFESYYYSEVIRLNSLILIIGIPGALLSAVTFLLIPKIKARLDNRQIVFLSAITKAAAGTLVFLIGMRSYTNLSVVIPLLVVQGLVTGFFIAVNSVVPTEMIADTVDYMEWKTGKRNEGMSFSVLTFVGKLTRSVSTAIGTALLPVIGLSFQKVSAAETLTVKGPHTDFFIWLLFTFAPVALGLFTLVPYIWYDLTGKKLKQIRAEIAQRRSELSKKLSGGNEDEK